MHRLIIIIIIIIAVWKLGKNTGVKLVVGGIGVIFILLLLLFVFNIKQLAIFPVQL